MSTVAVTPVVVGTNEGRQNFVDHFFATVPGWAEQFIHVVSGNYELAQIQEAYCNGLGSFLYLQDTFVVHDWDALFRKLETAPETAYCLPRPSCFSMLYSAKVLEQMEFPIVKDKEGSIFFETVFTDEYELRAKRMGFDVPVLYPEMTDHEAIAAGRYYWIPNTNGEQRLHLRSSCGTISKMKHTYR